MTEKTNVNPWSPPDGEISPILQNNAHLLTDLNLKSLLEQQDSTKPILKEVLQNLYEQDQESMRIMLIKLNRLIETYYQSFDKLTSLQKLRKKLRLRLDALYYGPSIIYMFKELLLQSVDTSTLPEVFLIALIMTFIRIFIIAPGIVAENIESGKRRTYFSIKGVNQELETLLQKTNKTIGSILVYFDLLGFDQAVEFAQGDMLEDTLRIITDFVEEKSIKLND